MPRPSAGGLPAPATTIVLPASGHAGFVESVRDVESVRASRERNIIMFEDGHAGFVESVRDVESVRASRERNIIMF